MNIDKTIDLFKTQHGWFATFYDQRDKLDMPKTYQTPFTRYAISSHVERAISSKYPGYTIFVIGG